jgi:hypothetical protein
VFDRMEDGAMVAAKIPVEKRRILRKLNPPPMGEVQLDLAPGETEVQQMSAALAIGGEEMEMKTGNVHALGEVRAPETDQRSAYLPRLEHPLLGSDLGERRMRADKGV